MQPTGRLTGKVALVTGGAQGIGRAVALRLAAEGADVVVAARRADERTRTVLDELAATGMGRLDILVNNAGTKTEAAFWDVTEDDYDQVMDVNLKSVFFLTQAFVRHLRAAGRPGRVINVSSVHEELPFPRFAAYGCSKGALKMLCRTLAIELAPHITVNNIAPGAIATPINAGLLADPARLAGVVGNIPLGRMGQPGDVAGVAAFLASDDAAYMTGATVVVDGGLLWNYVE